MSVVQQKFADVSEKRSTCFFKIEKYIHQESAKRGQR
jgi:hypothetical protein